VYNIATETGIPSYIYGNHSSQIIYTGEYGAKFPGYKRALHDIMKYAKNFELDQNTNVTTKTIDFPISQFWADANTLDPAIHHAMFQFVRSVRLFKAGFLSEAIIPFSCIVESALVFLQERKIITGCLSYSEVVKQFGGNREQQDIAQMLQFIRNHVSGHIGGWRWWDFDEIFSEYFNEFITLTSFLIEQMVIVEKTKRIVKSNPRKWSEWFWDNFLVLWKSIWESTMTEYFYKSNL